MDTLCAKIHLWDEYWVSLLSVCVCQCVSVCVCVCVLRSRVSAAVDADVAVCAVCELSVLSMYVCEVLWRSLNSALERNALCIWFGMFVLLLLLASQSTSTSRLIAVLLSLSRCWLASLWIFRKPLDVGYINKRWEALASSLFEFYEAVVSWLTASQAIRQPPAAQHPATNQQRPT